MSVIEVNNLAKHFGSIKAVDGISLTVDKGEIFGFLGPNGAGKTTTIRCLMDFIRPTSGSISMLGKDATKESVFLKSKIGYLSGYVHLFDAWSGKDHVEYVQKLNTIHDWPDELIKRFDFNPEIKARQLSSGNRQKLVIIMCFMKQPDILIMDEPTNALDPLLQNEVYELLEEESQRGATIFMSSHNLSEVDRVCSRVAIIKRGKLVATESISSLKEKKINTIHAYFAEHVSPESILTDNCELIKHSADILIFNVKGDINPVLSKISQHRLRDIDISQASLEEIFLEYYGVSNHHSNGL